MKTYQGLITELKDNQVFVFGCNPLGVNGNINTGKGGAALAALKNGWVEQGERLDNSLSKSGKAWGLTTVTRPGGKLTKTPEEIIAGILILYKHAKREPDKEFLVAYQGVHTVNLNGYSNRQLAFMFSYYNIPSNIVFELHFASLIPSITFDMI